MKHCRRVGKCRRANKRDGAKDRRRPSTALMSIPKESEETIAEAVGVLVHSFESFPEYQEERLSFSQRTESPVNSIV
jgi:hypothetical protein